MSVELSAVCTLSVLETAVLGRTPGPDPCCFGPPIAIYSAERKGQAGAEMLLCSGGRGYTRDRAFGESGQGALGVPAVIPPDLLVLSKGGGSDRWYLHSVCTWRATAAEERKMAPASSDSEIAKMCSRCSSVGSHLLCSH